MNAADIRDITGPVPIADPWLAALAVAGGLAVLALLWLGVRAWRAKRRHALTPEARALARLAAARRLLAPGLTREYGVAVSDAIRVYIEERFAARAVHRTTEEFLFDLAASGASVLANRRPLLSRFLEHCDLAKFARAPLAADEMEALHASALAFVREAGEAVPEAGRS